MYVISKYHILYKKAASIKNVKKKKLASFILRLLPYA